MSREKKRREKDEESWRKEIEKYEEAYERKQKDKRDSKEGKDSQILPNTVVPPPSHFQVPQFPIMQFQLGQPQYYQQFLVPPGLQMPPPMIIPQIRNLQSEERMDIPGTLTGMQPPQRPPWLGNPDYIWPLKRET
uniref:Uncharacterized protein n=1 Tax=Romanomermis culicivorax TaxID=13658 RepID=A0A915LD47_ROMCU